MVLFLQARGKKGKINKWELIKLKSFGTVKETITKQEPTKWEQIVANDSLVRV